MHGSDRLCEAVVIGGGFYGAAIAVYLGRQRGLRDIILVEREAALLSRASYNNQARVHNGYHYPRSFTTAYRSRVNLPRFVSDWPEAVSRNFTKLYAIARRNSKVTAGQFERFCREIGARIRPADAALRALFDPRWIENVFLVEEFAFDASILARWAQQELRACGVEVRLETRVCGVSKAPGRGLRVAMQTNGGHGALASCRYVFNCTYSGLNFTWPLDASRSSGLV